MIKPDNGVDKGEYQRKENNAFDDSPKASAEVFLCAETADGNIEERNQTYNCLSHDDPAFAEADQLTCF